MNDDYVNVLGYHVKFDWSSRKNKKYKVHIKELDKTIHFGSKNHEHYRTHPKIYQKNPNLNNAELWEHGDNERRKRYRKRAMFITDKYGNLTYKDITSPNYWSFNYLWS